MALKFSPDFALFLGFAGRGRPRSHAGSPSPGPAGAVSSKFATLDYFDQGPDDFQKFLPQQSVSLAAPTIRDYIQTLVKSRAQSAPFREVDCMQSDPDNVQGGFAICTV